MKEEFDALFAEHQKLLGELQAMRNVKRQWVGLTKKEVHDLYDSGYEVFYQRIEAKLKEKNT